METLDRTVPGVKNVADTNVGSNRDVGWMARYHVICQVDSFGKDGTRVLLLEKVIFRWRQLTASNAEDWATFFKSCNLLRGAGCVGIPD